MRKNSIKKNITGYLFIMPSLLLIAGFLIIPIVMAIYMSFFNRTLKKNEFIGLANYVNLLNDSTYLRAMFNTIIYVVVLVPSIVLVTMYISSVIIRKKQKIGSFYRGLFYIPTIASGVTVSIIWSWVFNPVMGIANYLIEFVGGTGIEWFSGRSTAFLCVCIVAFFISIGQPVILYTAALGGINSTYYEAAEIDGAGRWIQFTKITIPALRPTTLYITIISAVNAFQIFIPIQLLTNGGPVNATTSMMYIIYKTAFTDYKFGYAASMGVIMLLLLGTFSVAQFRVQNREEDL